MRAFVLALVAGAVGGFLTFWVLVATKEWPLIEKQLLFEAGSFVTCWAILGAIIGGAWEIVATIKQIRPLQTPGTDRKEE